MSGVSSKGLLPRKRTPQHPVRLKSLLCVQVVAWVASAEGGRFAKLALPAGLDGRRLLELSAQRLGQLFEGTMRKARASHEGEAWAIGVAEEGESVTDALGQALFKAVRRENQRICNLERKARDRGTEEADSNWTWLDC